MGGGRGSTLPKKCGLLELLVFVAAIICGSACSILSKTMMGLHGIGITGEEEIFRKPIFQTFGMFVGMMFGIPIHCLCMYFKIPFPGYEQYNCSTKKDKTEETKSLIDGHTSSVANNNGGDNNEDGDNSNSSNYGSLIEMGTSDNDRQQDGSTIHSTASTTAKAEATSTTGTIPTWMYFFLAIPSIFDLAATAFCMMGLQYIEASIYMLLRGSGIIFVALMKQYILGDHLYHFQWAGVAFNVLSVIMVGCTAILDETTAEEGHKDDEEIISGTAHAFLGVTLVMLGALVQAMQFVFEEKVMTMDIPSPPLLLIGMEGVWGTLLCLVIVYPLVYYLPGNDHGSYEDPFNTFAMFMNSKTIQIFFGVYFWAIFGYNFFAVLVTFMMNSVWHAILDNFRPITVWLTDLFIFYFITPSFGESWTTWSWLQLAGMGVLFFGTSVYNAPNAGSVLLKGQWYVCGLDFSGEYLQIEQEEMEEKLDEDWRNRMEQFQVRKDSSFFGERSPHTNVHTQSLRGLANTTA